MPSTAFAAPTPEQFETLFSLSLAWIVLILLGSAMYRRARSKPVFFFSVPESSFIERMGSGCSLQPWWRRFGGANNCLVVAVAQQRLIIRPFFPFNLLLLPEIFGLEYDVPVDRVIAISWMRRFFVRGLKITMRSEHGAQQECWIRLRNPHQFLISLGHPIAAEEP